MPVISVIVPVYKVEPYIHRCVDSILAQTFSDFELILVDDGSPDNCGAICDEYAATDSRVRVIHQENGGVSKARNSGLNKARGTYIAFCDSDDWWESGLLEHTVDEMQNYGLDWVSFSYRKTTAYDIGKSMQYPVEMYCFSNWESKLEYLFLHFLQNRSGWEIWTRVFRREIIDSNCIRFCETCGNFAEDMGFCVKFLLCARRIKSVENCFYNYYQREQSMMIQSQNVIKFDELNEVSLDVANFAKTILPEKTYEDYIGIMHYLIMKNQYNRLFYPENYKAFQVELSKINNQRWFCQATKHTIYNRRKLEELFGRRYAVQIVNFSFFCLYRLWYLYKLIKHITYIFMRKG